MKEWPEGLSPILHVKAHHTSLILAHHVRLVMQVKAQPWGGAREGCAGGDLRPARARALLAGADRGGRRHQVQLRLRC